MNRFTEQVVIVTGGADGIGKSACQRFAAEGAQVVIWDFNHEKGNESEKEIKATGGKARFMHVNTASWTEVEDAARLVFETYGRIDVLVNNAGITRDSSLKKMSPDQWQQVIDVNLSGVFFCTKAVSEFMTTRNYGRIINTTSVVALYGNFGQANYVASKAGVIGMTKTLARELGRKGITVNAVAPGFIATEMVAKMPENILQGMKDKTPVGRLGTPTEIASIYAYLASEEAGFINGAVISVDGGITI